MSICMWICGHAYATTVRVLRDSRWLLATSTLNSIVCVVCLLACRPSQDLPAHKWSRGSSAWKPVTLRVTAYGLEALQPESGEAPTLQHNAEQHHSTCTLSPFGPAASAAADMTFVFLQLYTCFSFLPAAGNASQGSLVVPLLSPVQPLSTNSCSPTACRCYVLLLRVPAVNVPATSQVLSSGGWTITG